MVLKSKDVVQRFGLPPRKAPHPTESMMRPIDTDVTFTYEGRTPSNKVPTRIQRGYETHVAKIEKGTQTLTGVYDRIGSRIGLKQLFKTMESPFEKQLKAREAKLTTETMVESQKVRGQY